MIDIVRNVKENEWKSFLNNCGEATIYHTPEWKQFLEKTFNYKAEYLFAKNESENIVGFLPLFYIRSKLTGDRLCSVPFSHRCGPLGTKDASNNLIEEAIHLFQESNLNSLEIRENIDNERFENMNYFNNYTLELPSKPNDIWTKLDRGCKRGITKAEKNGVSIETTRNKEDLKEFYEINAMGKRELGVPCHPWIFFRNYFDILGTHASLYVSRYKDEVIGGLIMGYFKDTMLSFYGASNSDYNKLYPNDALLWKCIVDACARDYKRYDAGRVHCSNTGLINYKKKWGTIETKLYYSNYPTKSNSLSENRESIKYKFASKVIEEMPLLMYKQFSSFVFRHFG